MSHIKVKKGLDIRLKGEADRITKSVSASKIYALRMSDFHGVTPKVIAKEGHTVKAGSPLFYDKKDERIKFASPVSGEVVEIVRGAKRKILEIRILPDSEQQFEDFGSVDIANTSAEDLKKFLLDSGAWAYVKQRPYDVIAGPDTKPKAIFVSGFSSAPMAPDFDYVLEGHKAELQAAVNALVKISGTDLHLSLSSKSSVSVFRELNNVKLHDVSGPHPAGNVGVQINKLNPINKGETVWTLAPDQLAILGKLLLTGNHDMTKTVAVTGSEVNNPHYMSLLPGANMGDVLNGFVEDAAHVRIISGNVLTGNKVNRDEPLGFYDAQVTVIPEGDDYDFFGWNLPKANKFSLLRANMFSFLTPGKKYDLNSNTNGEERAFVLTGHYEKVFPMDVLPMQLLKSVLYKDIDEMEKLGIYEVAPEDFALTEFVCPSKTNQQEIIREGLDLMIEEVG